MDNKSRVDDDLLKEAGDSVDAKADEEIPALPIDKSDDVVPESLGQNDGEDASPDRTDAAQAETAPEPAAQTECEIDSEPWNESENVPATECSETGNNPKPVALPDEEACKEQGKKKTFSKGILIFLFVFASAIALVIAYVCTHAILGDIFGKHEIYSSGTREINLSGSDYENYSQLSKVSKLEVIDLTNSTFSDLADLYGCKRIKTVILAGKEMEAQDCIDFFQKVPGARIICKVKIGDQLYDYDTKQIKVESADGKTQKLYAALRSLEELDLTACDVNDETYQYLHEMLINCEIIIRTEICGKEYTTDSESVVFDGEISDRDAKRIHYFNYLKLVDIKNCTNPDRINSFLSAHSELRVNRPVDLLGKRVGTEDEIVDLRGSKYTLKEVKAALEEKLPELKKLKKIDMCGCGLSNSEMEQLCKAYPDIKFVWMVHFKRWSVRTDAVVFSTLNGDGYEFYDQNDYAPVFKYCTDLIALDLGHSLIYDISPIASMKNLRAVILTDNKIHNISAFSNLKDLEFIEINVNRVESAEPLRNLNKLKYIDFWSSKSMTNLEPLYNHKELKLAIFHRTVSLAERRRFMKSNPDCETYFKVDTVKTTTNRAWRTNPYRKKLKTAFKNWKNVVGFDEKTGNYIFDYDTDQYSIM